MYKISEALIQPKMSEEEKKKLRQEIRLHKKEPGLFDKQIEELVKIEGNEVSVDWKGFRQKQFDGYSSEFEQDFYRKLHDLKVLSFGSNGNFEVRGCGISLNPNIHIFETYFTSEKQARAYKEAIYADALYDVGIIRIEIKE